jgi:uncharacterized membrane protein
MDQSGVAMELGWDACDQEIARLRTMVYGADAMFGSLERRNLLYPYGNVMPETAHDWRPAWALAKAIQALFDGGIRYPSRSEREQAWKRFNETRGELARRSNEDRETAFRISKFWRDFLIEQIEREKYSLVSDALFFFDPVTVEEMKASGARLRECGSRLSQGKRYMLREHKDECFQRIVEVQQSHDVFWNRLKVTRAQHQVEIRSRLESSLSRLDENISKNREKRRDAEAALDRCELNIAKLRDMLSSARGDDFRAQCESWLDGALTKRSSILDTIARYDEWIVQDEERRSDLRQRRR